MAKAGRDGDFPGLLMAMEWVSSEAVSVSEARGACYKYRFQGHGIAMEVGVKSGEEDTL